MEKKENLKNETSKQIGTKYYSHSRQAKKSFPLFPPKYKQFKKWHKIEEKYQVYK